MGPFLSPLLHLYVRTQISKGKCVGVRAAEETLVEANFTLYQGILISEQSAARSWAWWGNLSSSDAWRLILPLTLWKNPQIKVDPPGFQILPVIFPVEYGWAGNRYWLKFLFDPASHARGCSWRTKVVVHGHQTSFRNWSICHNLEFIENAAQSSPHHSLFRKFFM